jgi:hypothetical protein
MSSISYLIQFTNVEGTLHYLSVFDADGDSGLTSIEGSEEPAIMETPELDEDKTQAIRAKRLKIGFNSTDDPDLIDADFFSGGGDDRFSAQLRLEFPPDDIYVFLGNLIADNNSEAFQPRPNPVSLIAVDGLNSLKGLELQDDGELPVGHFTIAQFITMCLDIMPQYDGFRVIMNLYEEDTDPVTSHAWAETFLDARTFEKDIDSREDRFTVLEKILEAFGCFIAYESREWWIIRWDEYDVIGTSVLLHRAATFDVNGNFVSYESVDLTKHIAHDESGDYEGYRLSMDSAIKKFQRKASKLKHTYRFQQPKEVPCNVKFTRGTPIDTVLPLLTFEPECWTMRKNYPGGLGSPTVDAYIGVRYDANDYETERYLAVPPVSSHLTDSVTYLESEKIPVVVADKFNFSYEWRVETGGTFGAQYFLGRVMLEGDDGSYWLLGHESIFDSSTPLRWWDTTGFTVNTAAGNIDIDTTLIDEEEWQSVSWEAPPIPVSGNLYIWLNQMNQTTDADDNTTVNYTGLEFTYIPYINGTYKTSLAQSNEVSADNGSRKTIEKEMFISDSPRPLFKGALKKFDGTNYVLTENWNQYNNLLGITDDRLSKHVVFAWWNQYRKRRTVIDTDVQGINPATESIPGLIHRWKIHHATEGDKWFMMTSMRSLNFRTCGGQYVFVETSDLDGDRDYEDTFTFKYIQ